MIQIFYGPPRLTDQAIHRLWYGKTKCSSHTHFLKKSILYLKEGQCRVRLLRGDRDHRESRDSRRYNLVRDLVRDRDHNPDNLGRGLSRVSKLRGLSRVSKVRDLSPCRDHRHRIYLIPAIKRKYTGGRLSVLI
jgi:hypothetical protein